jgi:uncharacterized protein YjbI with pentapeptide repeats
MNDKQFKHRWEERKHKVADKVIIEALKAGIIPGRIEGLSTYYLHGVKYFDLSGMTIEDEVLDIGKLGYIDFSHTRLINVKFTSDATLSNFRFDSAELINVSFKPTNQNLDTRLILENFVFKGAKIENSDFSSNDFSGRNYFLNSNFHNVDFSNSDFERSIFCDFTQTKFYGCSFSESNLVRVILCKCLFSDCDLRDAWFNKTNLSKIVFKNCIVNTVTTFDEKIILEKNRSFEKASEVYTQLKKLFSNSGHSRESEKYHVRKMISLRRKEKNPLKKLASWIYWLTAGYGESPFRILYWMLLVIIAFAVGYHCSNISYSGYAQGMVKDFCQCLYFSIVTFTTLGYGDWLPDGNVSKALAGIESFSGLVFLAIFSVLIAKKMSRD